ncbi:hypothetical protein K3727_19910 [Rhodobacteraceae bacterium M382]|nr:hypothetical protein K3727_19910 [Rhodobacteraceae bacterium M382]
MSYELFGADAPGIAPCRYGESKLLVRGPERDLTSPYIAILGGTEVFGRFVDMPFAALLESQLGRTCVNFGCVNAGLDSFMHDPGILRRARSSQVSVVQIMGAQNLSNRYFRVHPRRNDRLVEVLPKLVALFPEIDFTEFHFNRHLLNTIQQVSEARFAVVQDELQRVWLSRMRLLIRALGANIVLLWIRYGPNENAHFLDHEPPLVSRHMVETLGPQVRGVVVTDVQRADAGGEVQDMEVGPVHRPIAGHVIGPCAHRRVAADLEAFLRAL